MADVPHFALPFRFGRDGHAVVVEQDSTDDIAACVEAVLRTRPGEREELPAFGSPDPTFEQAPVRLDAIAAAVAAWEPRAEFLLEEAPDALDATVRRVRLTIDTED